MIGPYQLALTSRHNLLKSDGMGEKKLARVDCKKYI